MNKFFYLEDFTNCFSEKYAAEAANAKLNKLLLSATIVYCDKDELHFSGVDEIGYTHKGYLIGVEEIKIEPCIHEPDFPGYGNLICKHCGLEIYADWKAK